MLKTNPQPGSHLSASRNPLNNWPKEAFDAALAHLDKAGVIRKERYDDPLGCIRDATPTSSNIQLLLQTLCVAHPNEDIKNLIYDVEMIEIIDDLCKMELPYDTYNKRADYLPDALGITHLSLRIFLDPRAQKLLEETDRWKHKSPLGVVIRNNYTGGQVTMPLGLDAISKFHQYLPGLAQLPPSRPYALLPVDPEMTIKEVQANVELWHAFCERYPDDTRYCSSSRAGDLPTKDKDNDYSLLGGVLDAEMSELPPGQYVKFLRESFNDLQKLYDKSSFGTQFTSLKRVTETVHKEDILAFRKYPCDPAVLDDGRWHHDAADPAHFNLKHWLDLLSEIEKNHLHDEPKALRLLNKFNMYRISLQRRWLADNITELQLTKCGIPLRHYKREIRRREYAYSQHPVYKLYAAGAGKRQRKSARDIVSVQRWFRGRAHFLRAQVALNSIWNPRPKEDAAKSLLNKENLSTIEPDGAVSDHVDEMFSWLTHGVKISEGCDLGLMCFSTTTEVTKLEAIRTEGNNCNPIVFKVLGAGWHIYGEKHAGSWGTTKLDDILFTGSTADSILTDLGVDRLQRVSAADLSHEVWSHIISKGGHTLSENGKDDDDNTMRQIVGGGQVQPRSMTKAREAVASPTDSTLGDEMISSWVAAGKNSQSKPPMGKRHELRVKPCRKKTVFVKLLDWGLIGFPASERGDWRMQWRKASIANNGIPTSFIFKVEKGGDDPVEMLFCMKDVTVGDCDLNTAVEWYKKLATLVLKRLQEKLSGSNDDPNFKLFFLESFFRFLEVGFPNPVPLSLRQLIESTPKQLKYAEQLFQEAMCRKDSEKFLQHASEAVQELLCASKPGVYLRYASEAVQESLCASKPWEYLRYASEAVQESLCASKPGVNLRYASEAVKIFLCKTSKTQRFIRDFYATDLLMYTPLYFQKIMCEQVPNTYLGCASEEVQKSLCHEDPEKYCPYVSEKLLVKMPAESQKISCKLYTSKYFPYASEAVQMSLCESEPGKYLRYASVEVQIGLCKQNPSHFARHASEQWFAYSNAMSMPKPTRKNIEVLFHSSRFLQYPDYVTRPSGLLIAVASMSDKQVSVTKKRICIEHSAAACPKKTPSLFAQQALATEEAAAAAAAASAEAAATEETRATRCK